MESRKIQQKGINFIIKVTPRHSSHGSKFYRQIFYAFFSYA